MRIIAQATLFPTRMRAGLDDPQKIEAEEAGWCARCAKSMLPPLHRCWGSIFQTLPSTSTLTAKAEMHALLKRALAYQLPVRVKGHVPSTRAAGSRWYRWEVELDHRPDQTIWKKVTDAREGRAAELTLMPARAVGNGRLETRGPNGQRVRRDAYKWCVVRPADLRDQAGVLSS